MRLAIYWADIMHYHAARLAALYRLADFEGHQVVAFALSSQSSKLPVTGYQALLGNQVQVLCEQPEIAGPYSPLSKRQLIVALLEANPDAVAIIGYDGRVSRGALAGCRYRRRGAVLMLETQAKDSPRYFRKEWPKSQLVRLTDAVFCGGSAHAWYATQLGMASDRIWTGYDAVDNDYWGRWRIVKEDLTTWRHRYQVPERFFLTACRFIPKKNLTGLLKAYAAYVSQAVHILLEPGDRRGWRARSDPQTGGPGAWYRKAGVFHGLRSTEEMARDSLASAFTCRACTSNNGLVV